MLGVRQAFMRLDLAPFRRAWRLQVLIDWFTRTFPELSHGRSRRDIEAHLEPRIFRAEALGFVRLQHWQYLLTYEAGCGIDVFADPTPSTVIAALQDPDVDPDCRITDAEKRIYGRRIND